MTPSWLFAAGLALVGCARPTAKAEVRPPEPVEIQAPVAAKEPETAPALAPASARPTFEETDSPPPVDLRLRIDKSGEGWALRAERRDAIVSIRRAGERATGKDRAALELAEGVDAPIVIETTRAKDLLTTRVVARVARAAGERPAVVAHLAEAPREVGADAREAHDCRAHDDGFGGFAVVCRISSPANAGAITGEDVNEGVFASVGSTSLVRLDLDLDGAPAVSKAVAYNSHGRGVLVRAEASLAPGEEAPTLVVLSAARQQPVVRPIRPFCRLPRHLNEDRDRARDDSML